MNSFDHSSGNYFNIDGARIYAEVKGESPLEPLLFLHGGFGNIEDFNPILGSLRKEFRLIGIDSRGQGRSTLGDEALTYERIQKDVEAVLKELGIERPSVIGFSDGGIVGYRMACFSKLKIAKLITIGSRWHVDNARETADILGGTTAARWKSRFPETVQKYLAINPEPDFEKLAPFLVRMWLDDGRTGYPNENIKEIDFPVLVIRGDSDHLLTRGAAFRAAESIGGSVLANIPFAGHVAFTEQKDIVMRLVNDFLDK